MVFVAVVLELFFVLDDLTVESVDHTVNCGIHITGAGLGEN